MTFEEYWKKEYPPLYETGKEVARHAYRAGQKSLVGKILELKKHLGPTGEYALCRSDGEKLWLGEVLMFGLIFEGLDELYEDLE